jgi:hypothetical protein
LTPVEVAIIAIVLDFWVGFVNQGIGGCTEANCPAQCLPLSGNAGSGVLKALLTLWEISESSKSLSWLRRNAPIGFEGVPED